MVINKILKELNTLYYRKMEIEHTVTKGGNSLDMQFNLLQEYRDITEQERELRRKLKGARNVEYITL